jgi:hypothetical protein
MGKCRCGCGKDISIAKHDYLIKYEMGHGRWFKTKPYIEKDLNETKKCECSVNCIKIIKRYDLKERERRYYKGHRPHNNKGYKDKRGYMRIWNPDHTNSLKDGYIQEHRLVMSEHLGRPLTKNEVVHHKNKILDDNRIENLELIENQSKHISNNHNKKDFSNRICSDCDSKETVLSDGYVHWYKNPDEQGKYLCFKCYVKRRKKIISSSS